jgi:hypothetical protein
MGEARTEKYLKLPKLPGDRYYVAVGKFLIHNFLTPDLAAI